MATRGRAGVVRQRAAVPLAVVALAAALAVAVGVAGCSQARIGGGSAAVTAADLVGTWSGPGGASVDLRADGSAVLSAVPGTNAEGAVGEPCTWDFLSLISGGAWSLGADASSVRVVGAESPLPVEIDVTLQLRDDGRRLTGLFCDGGAVAEWAFVPADEGA